MNSSYRLSTVSPCPFGDVVYALIVVAPFFFPIIRQERLDRIAVARPFSVFA